MKQDPTLTLEPRALQEFSGKLGELSGPLAEHLRRIGEQAGDLNMDVHLLKDLKVFPFFMEGGFLKQYVLI